MSGLSGKMSSLQDFASDLRRLPTVAAQKVAAAGADALTPLLQQTFAAGEDAYGNTWAPGANGQRVTLRAGGGLAAGLYFLAIGTRIRMRLGVSYAKYQVGRRPVAPRAGGALPIAWLRTLQRTAVDVCRAELHQ